MNHTPEALQLARELDTKAQALGCPLDRFSDALRHQHARIAELEAAVLRAEYKMEGWLCKQYPLETCLYPDSKDWVEGSYRDRVEWLHTMYESAKIEIAQMESMLNAVGAGGVGQSIKPQVQADTPQPTAADQEPVATVQTINGVTIGYLEKRLQPGTKLYAAPQPARQPLTEDQLRDALRQCPHDTTENLRVRWLYAKDFARAIEAAHGITWGQQ